MSLEYRPYGDDLLPPIVRFWNDAFGDRRNFFPVTEKIFRARVVDKRTAVERFDPAHFLVAREGERVVGAVHVGLRPPEVCRALYADWPGGAQGYVAFLAVLPGSRGRGIGSELWRRGRELLPEGIQIALDGQCINPFYGNSEGPFTPFWGTPEGISISWDDSATKKFFARRGYAPRFKGVQLELDLSPASIAGDVPEGFELKLSTDYYPEPGHPFGTRERYTHGVDYECVSALREGRVEAVLSFFPLPEAGEGIFAIYEAAVLEEARHQGLGGALLSEAVRRMKARGGRRCDVLTIPEISEPAYRLYTDAGFRPCERWAIY